MPNFKEIKISGMKPAELAIAIVRDHIQKLKGIDQLQGVGVGKASPIYDGGGKSTFFEVTLKKGKKDSGYVIVSVDRSDFTIHEFTTEGESLTQRYRKLARGKKHRITWYTPTYSVATGARGKFIAKIGEYRPDKKMLKSMRDPKDRDELHSKIWERHKEFRKKKEKAIKKKWNRLYELEKKTSELVEDTLPTDFDYYAYYAEGHDISPMYNQIPPGAGVNNTTCYSGCGAAAWAILIAWHDRIWAPDILRGSNYRNRQNYGPPGDLNTELADETYIDRIMIELRRKLRTFCDGQGGAVYHSDMKRGFDYIEDDLGFNISRRHHGSGNNSTIHFIDEVFTVDEKPVIITTPGHYCVVAGYMRNRNSNDIDDQWVYINTGWQSMKYISSAYVDNYWYIRNIYGKRKLNRVNHKGTPAITTKRSNPPHSQSYEEMFLFWLDNGNRIRYSKSIGDYPNPRNNSLINIGGHVKSKFTPAVTSDGNNIYLAYVRMDDTVGVLQWSKKNNWEALPFPNGVTSNVRPAICGGTHDWLTVAICDTNDGIQKIANNGDANRSTHWPHRLDDNGADKFWKPIYGVTWQTGDDLSMVRFSGKTILGWRYYSYGSSSTPLALWYANADSSEPVAISQRSDLWPLLSPTHYMYSAPSFAVCNQTLYLAYRTNMWNGDGWGDGRIAIDRVSLPTRHEGWKFDTAGCLRETCEGTPNLGFLQMEPNDAHPMLTVAYRTIFPNFPFVSHPWEGKEMIGIKRMSTDYNLRPINYTNQP